MEIDQSNFVDMSKLVNFNSSINFVSHKRKKNRNNIRVTKVDSLYVLNKSPIMYDNKTMQYYRVARTRKLDPILNEIVDGNIAFKFEYRWDPYTGERMGIDPYGPLYFHPASLIHYFYVHRLDGLWKNEEEINDEVLQGYYDMFVGVGDEMEVVGRGKFMERYLFRLPILDCYLTSDHSEKFITMGPKLTDLEIEILEKLSQTSEVKNFYLDSFGVKCPNVTLIKKLYDTAIRKISNTEKCDSYKKENYLAIDRLKCM